MRYENRIITNEVRSSADILRDAQQQLLRDEQKRKLRTTPPRVAATPVSNIPRPGAWPAISGQLDLKRKALALIAA